MKKARFSQEHMVTILREADEKPVPEVAKKHGVSAQTIYGWRKHFRLARAGRRQTAPPVGAGERPAETFGRRSRPRAPGPEGDHAKNVWSVPVLQEKHL